MDDQIDEWRARETNLGVALVFSACKLLQSQVRVVGCTSPQRAPLIIKRHAPVVASAPKGALRGT